MKVKKKKEMEKVSPDISKKEEFSETVRGFLVRSSRPEVFCKKGVLRIDLQLY